MSTLFEIKDNVNIPQQILEGLGKIQAGTCAHIALHCRCTLREVEKNISSLVESGRAKKLHHKVTASPNGRRSNVYALPHYQGEWKEQMSITFKQKIK